MTIVVSSRYGEVVHIGKHVSFNPTMEMLFCLSIKFYFVKSQIYQLYLLFQKPHLILC